LTDCGLRIGTYALYTGAVFPCWMKTGDSFEKPGKERGVGVFGARTTGFGATDVVRVRGENDPINFSVLRMTERSLFIRLTLDTKNSCTTGSGCVPTCLMWIGGHG